MKALEVKLVTARERLLRAQGRSEGAAAKSKGVTPGGMSGYDPAVLSGIRRKIDHKKDAQRFAAYDREAAACRELVECEREVTHLESRIAREKLNAPVPYTPEELKASRAVRDTHGWHKVAKVNAKTVSVETGYSWTDRISIEKILEVRT